MFNISDKKLTERRIRQDAKQVGYSWENSFDVKMVKFYMFDTFFEVKHFLFGRTRLHIEGWLYIKKGLTSRIDCPKSKFLSKHFLAGATRLHIEGWAYIEKGLTYRIDCTKSKFLGKHFLAGVTGLFIEG